MADISISREDVLESESFFRAYLQVKIPDGDFAQGSPAGDYLVTGHAYVRAYFLKLIKIIRDRQSLRTLVNLPNDEDTVDATDAILDNIFLPRNAGKFARGTALCHFSSRVDSRIPSRNRFFKTKDLVYYPDSTSDIFIASSSLRPNFGADGQVIDWVAPINLVAARVGLDYNQDRGRFVAADKFSAFLTFVENINPLFGGDGTETNAKVIQRSRTAISLRALINSRSNEAVLSSNFTAILSVFTAGYGDPEMVRDILQETNSGITLHIGGFTDIYCRLPLQEVVERLEVNLPTPRADDRILVFRDTAPPTGDFRVAGVKPGDILSIGQGIPEAPFQYVVRGVRQLELDVSIRTPFSIATDELGAPPTFRYTVGDNYPTFNNKIDVTAGTLTASTSRQFSFPNRVVLSGRPLYRVKRVELTSSSAGLDPYRDPVTGTVLFRNRVNQSVLATPRPGDTLAYRVIIENPTESHTAKALNTVEVGWPAIDLTGFFVEVTYDTLSGFDTVASYVVDPRNRVSAANTLVRGHHPVYLSLSIPYRLTQVQGISGTTVTNPFDPTAASNALTSFINDYDSVVPMDQSTLSAKALSIAAGSASIYPFLVKYDFFAPDGSIYRYQTQDAISIIPDGVTSTATLINPTDVGLPATDYQAALRKRILAMGVTDRNTRLFASSDAISFFVRS